MRALPPHVRRSDVTAFLPILLANLVPLVGISLFGWRVSELLVIYWVEVCVMLVVYGLAALFAKRPIATQGRTLFLPGVKQDGEGRREASTRERNGIEVPGAPPIYPHDIGVVSRTFVWGVAFWVFPVFALGTEGLVWGAFSPPVIGTTVAIVLSHLAELRRDFFLEKRYEEMSAHMVLEIPIRIILFPLFLLLFIAFLGWPWLFFAFLVVPELFGVALTAARIELAVASAAVGMKLTVEWARFFADRDPDPGRITRWFLPQDPRDR